MTLFSSKYNHYIDSDYIVVNLISTSIIKLDQTKFIGLKENNLSVFSKVEIENLVEMLFIVNIENEKAYYLNKKIRPKVSNRLGLTILTTTDCNARCSYCYQSGVRRKTMNDDTQTKIIEFIKTRKPSLLHITWFGGEPLLNADAIDYITRECINNNIKFYSTIITNGLLVEKFLSKFVHEWRIKSTQITIDGIDDKYNNCKNYIDSELNPFEKVISNVDKLLNNGIQVSIRMNFNKDNYKNISEAIDFIYNKFQNHKKLRIYLNNIYGNTSSFHLNDGSNLYLLLYKKLIKYGYINNIKDLRIYTKDEYCFIYDENHFVIGPNGNIYKCEHAILDDSVGKIGTIQEGITSKTNYDFWQNPLQPYGECNNCKFWFVCQGGCKHQHYFADYKSSQCVWVKEIFDDLIKTYCQYKEAKQCKL